VEGLLPGKRSTDQPTNFAEWILAVFGEGLAWHFMIPYNFKVWATPAELMAYAWIGERVSVVNLEGVLKNLILGEGNVTWGPNSMFRFPLHGGTGEIFRKLAAGLGDRVRLSSPVAHIDPDAKLVRTAQGMEYQYECLLNTGPLSLLILDIMQRTETALRDAAADLLHNSVYVSGIGVNSYRPDDTCWMYFPENNCPFYRVTNFHNYSPNNVPIAGQCRALMAETSYSTHKREALDKLTQSTIDGLVNTALLTPEEAEKQIASTWSFCADYGYPVPSLGRDKALAVLQPWLEEREVYSRGRFGGWRYEVANMDHTVMQGVEWAQRMVLGQTETTYEIPVV
jgi:UDP-galactopyranose mutase